MRDKKIEYLGKNPFNHTWDYCGVCRSPMVRCGKCGNACCTGGYGEFFGKECDACPSAYDMQAEEEAPKFSQEYMDEKNKNGRGAMGRLFGKDDNAD